MNNSYEGKDLVVFLKRKDEDSFYYESEGDCLKKSIINTLFAPNRRFYLPKEKFTAEEKKESPFPVNKDSVFVIRIVVHSAKDICAGQASSPSKLVTFGQDFFINEGIRPTGDIRSRVMPIVHVTLVSGFVEALYGSLENSAKLASYIPRSYQIMDSSIWNKIVPFDKNEKYKVGGFEGLYDAVKEIEGNYKHGLYDLEVAREYANLNARLAKQAFLSGSHASGVSPFIFHSESAIAKLIEKEFSPSDNGASKEMSTIQSIEKQNWRILLVDDKSEDALAPKELGVTKLTIIERLLKDLFKNAHVDSKQYGANDESVRENIKQTKEANKDQKGKILVEYVETIEGAEKALKSKKYDIILLDYLLEREGRGRQYGYELLENIYNFLDAKKTFAESSRESVMNDVQETGATPKSKYESYLVREAEELEKLGDGKEEENTRKEIRLYKECKNIISANSDKINSEIAKEIKNRLRSENRGCAEKIYGILKNYFEKNKYQIGPHDKLFFMFISAYTTAVYERLLAEGLNRNEKYWYIGEGACPTNTPELFKYRLLHIMDRRLDQTGIKRLSYENILTVVKKIYKGEKTHGNKREHIAFVRSNANRAYHEILGFHYDYFLLKKDEEASVLVASFLKGKEHFGAMLEHLLQLVHLTAFGTVRQWPEIWEECQFLMRTIDDNNNEIRSLKNEIVAAIESYVIDLKSE